ncbi:MAG: hypothetical protein GWN10_02225, partial [Nitrospinaceae bacterium]|nr:hypothetical protein [Nitrospinaceae bacterium]NIW04714.1 hypothetical protein [Nitrospinaceae bacterium]NIX33214.1 hypothetical protein [Nitrospinaceae bacterium]
MAQAASQYASAIEDSLNTDELNAIQDLSVQVKAAVSEFLSQSDLEVSGEVQTVVAENSAAVQNLEANLEQAVNPIVSAPPQEAAPAVTREETLKGLPVTDGLDTLLETDQLPEIEDINVEGAQGDFTVTAASPALANAAARDNAPVENPVTPEVTAAPSPVHGNAPAVTAEDNTQGDFTVIAASPALANAAARDNAPVENPVHSPAEPAVASPPASVGPAGNTQNDNGPATPVSSGGGSSNHGNLPVNSQEPNPAVVPGQAASSGATGEDSGPAVVPEGGNPSVNPEPQPEQAPEASPSVLSHFVQGESESANPANVRKPQ